MLADRKPEALTVRDSAASYDVLVYVKARDGTDKRVGLPAAARRVGTLTYCADHLIARGVCVTCTQELGEIIYAS